MDTKAALGAAAGLTLTLAGGVSALFLSTGLLQASEPAGDNSAVTIEYVDENGNSVEAPSNSAAATPEVVVVYPDETQAMNGVAADATAEQAMAEEPVEPAYMEAEEYEEAEYEEAEEAEYEEAEEAEEAEEYESESEEYEEAEDYEEAEEYEDDDEDHAEGVEYEDD